MTNLQTEALAAFAEIWKLCPEVRLGQLMAHLGFLAETHLDKGLGTIDDDEMLAILYRHHAELKARLDGSTHRAPLPPSSDVSISGSPMARQSSS